MSALAVILRKPSKYRVVNKTINIVQKNYSITQKVLHSTFYLKVNSETGVDFWVRACQATAYLLHRAADYIIGTVVVIRTIKQTLSRLKARYTHTAAYLSGHLLHSFTLKPATFIQKQANMQLHKCSL